MFLELERLLTFAAIALYLYDFINTWLKHITDRFDPGIGIALANFCPEVLGLFAFAFWLSQALEEIRLFKTLIQFFK